jgi:hypothetical protein
MKKTLRRCQAKRCAKLGKARVAAHWSYFMCAEHFGLLSASDKLWIARNEGTEFEKRFRAQSKVIELNQPT